MNSQGSFQSPAVFLVYASIVALSFVASVLDDSTLRWETKRSLAPFLTGILFAVDIALMLFDVQDAALVIGVRVLEIAALINWFLSSLVYAAPEQRCNQGFVLPVAVAALYFGFLAGELNNDNNFAEKMAKRKLVKYLSQHPMTFVNAMAA